MQIPALFSITIYNTYFITFHTGNNVLPIFIGMKHILNHFHALKGLGSRWS